MRAPTIPVLLVAVMLVASSCGDHAGSASPAGGSGGASSSTAAGRAQDRVAPGHYFSDVTGVSGLDQPHVGGMSERKFMPETVGSGAAFADFDGDGRLDAYLVNQRLLLAPEAAAPGNRLYRQRADGAFEDVSARSGAADRGFGLGCATADYDGDGDVDLYVLNLGPNRLYRNRGDGTFEDVTEAAGVAHPGWGTSAVFLDYDKDGDLDIFSVNYVDYAVERNVDCYIGGILAYCSPHAYPPAASTLYRNRGDGTFEDVSGPSGIGAQLGKGLGVSLADFDADGWIDVYVANDGVRNFLFRNQGDGTFEEIGVESGTAYNEAGVAEAGMGTDFADLNGDGRPDILVTNLDNELNNVFFNNGDGSFDERARQSGMGAVSHALVGFGCRAFDYDDDGDLDVYVTNGHITDNIADVNPSTSYRQPDFLFLGDGRGRFTEVLRESGDVEDGVGRGVALGDYDDDGDLDVLVTNNSARPFLLRNDQRSGNGWIGFALVGRGANRDALGALLSFRAGEREERYEHRQRGTYLTAHDPRLLFGLGTARGIDGLVIVWPDGSRQEIGALAGGSYYRVVVGEAPVKLPRP